jgi:hypothetical protein
VLTVRRTPTGRVIYGVVPAEIAAVRVTREDKSTQTVESAPIVGYAGRYAAGLRQVVVDLRGGTPVVGIAALDAGARVLRSNAGAEDVPLQRPRTVLRVPGVPPLRVGNASRGSDKGRGQLHAPADRRPRRAAQPRRPARRPHGLRPQGARAPRPHPGARPARTDGECHHPDPGCRPRRGSAGTPCCRTSAKGFATAHVANAEVNVANAEVSVSAGRRAPSSGQQLERGDVLWADDAEVAPVDGGDLGDVQALGGCDD